MRLIFSLPLLISAFMISCASSSKVSPPSEEAIRKPSSYRNEACTTEAGQIKAMNDYLEKNVGPMTMRSLSRVGYQKVLSEVCPCETATGRAQILKDARKAATPVAGCETGCTDDQTLSILCQ